MQALVRWSRVGVMENPAGWVRTVAVRRLLNAKRSRTRELAATARLGTSTAEPTSDDTLDVRDVLQTLTPQQRIVVGMYYGGGYPIAEVAAAIGSLRRRGEVPPPRRPRTAPARSHGGTR